jgi:hypothetical protein
MQKLLTLLDAIIYSCLPFVITLVFSSLTLVTLVRHRRRNKTSLRKNYNETTNSSHLTSATATTTKTRTYSVMSSDIISKKKHSHHLSKLKLTLMLMTFPLTYLLTTLPVFVIITLKLLENYFENLASFETNFESELLIAKTLMYANNSFNVLLFILLGKTLRNDVIQLFRFKRVSKTRMSGGENLNINENANFKKRSRRMSSAIAEFV